jgi:uncharacterized membrane protein HdeD (DUF308 family)
VIVFEDLMRRNALERQPAPCLDFAYLWQRDGNPMTRIEILPTDPNEQRKARFWFIAEGAVILGLGVMAAALPVFAGLAVALVFAWMLLLSGLVGFVALTVSRGQAHPCWRIVSALASILAGALVLSAPLAGVLIIALLVAAYMVVNAVASFALASEQRRASSPGWGWRILTCVIDLVLAGFIIVLRPGSENVLVGYVVAIDLMIAGIALVALGLAVTRAAHGGAVARPAPKIAFVVDP